MPGTLSCAHLCSPVCRNLARFFPQTEMLAGFNMKHLTPVRDTRIVLLCNVNVLVVLLTLRGVTSEASVLRVLIVIK